MRAEVTGTLKAPVTCLQSQRSQRSLSFDSWLKGGEEEVSARYSSIVTIHLPGLGGLSHTLRLPYAGINLSLQIWDARYGAYCPDFGHENAMPGGSAPILLS